MRKMIPAAALLMAAALLATTTGCGAPADAAEPKDPAALEGGTPLPQGAVEVEFPWIGKQSVMCVGESVERQIAFVDFSDDEHDRIGMITVDTKGAGKGSFRVLAGDLRTGHANRDEHLLGPMWLDAKSTPEVRLEIASLERVKPTVWRAKGTWTMKGKSVPVEFLANVRYVPEMKNVGRDVVRVSASFPVRINEFGIGGEHVPSDAVADQWDVNIVLLGVMKKQ
jgi:hypothetical protein